MVGGGSSEGDSRFDVKIGGVVLSGGMEALISHWGGGGAEIGFFGWGGLGASQEVFGRLEETNVICKQYLILSNSHSLGDQKTNLLV